MAALILPMFYSAAAAVASTAPPGMSSALPSWVSKSAVAAITEPQAMQAFSSMQSAELTLPAEVATGPVTTTYLRTGSSSSTPMTGPPMLLIHGFDISCLEYRRLLPLLEAAGVEAYAPCIAGWGFTDTTNMRSVGVEAKRAQLLAFHEQVLGSRPAIWVGASLGACISLDCFKAKPGAFASFAALDPGFFTEAPPVVPSFVGRFLLRNVLGTPSVRESIAKQAYYVKEDQTPDGVLRSVERHMHAKTRSADDVTCQPSPSDNDYPCQPSPSSQPSPLATCTSTGQSGKMTRSNGF